ncbi:DUF6296 family protein [Streptomyces sp. NPDC006339]|uniref:DUF6296 family protein n=1 Tax=Streptomyces sp. NPDC006339 TaxID=3156755 RepID=UPI0033B55996
MSAPRYELVFSDAVGSARDVVVVERTSATGPGGHPVYADPTGIIRAEISDRDEVRVLASGGHQQPPQGVVAHRLREAPEGGLPDAGGQGDGSRDVA